MKIKGDCRYEKKECQHLCRPMYHSGFTGKSGPETWWSCNYHKRFIRDIRVCELVKGNWKGKQIKPFNSKPMYGRKKYTASELFSGNVKD